jgi:hypothetical protein
LRASLAEAHERDLLLNSLVREMVRLQNQVEILQQMIEDLARTGNPQRLSVAGVVEEGGTLRSKAG